MGIAILVFDAFLTVDLEVSRRLDIEHEIHNSALLGPVCVAVMSKVCPLAHITLISPLRQSWSIAKVLHVLCRYFFLAVIL